MNKEKKDYIVDVAGERVYQNQSKEYSDAYTEWRNNSENKFAYRFVHDTREHIYIDGEGYADEFAAQAERGALKRCFGFLGILMLVMLALQALYYIVANIIYDNPFFGWVYYSQRDTQPVVTAEQVYLYSVFKILTPAVLIFIVAFVVKIPHKIAVPNEKFNVRIFTYGIFISLIFLVVSRCFDYFLTELFSLVNVDISYYYCTDMDSAAAFGVYYATDMLIFPILVEILFRGYVLQLFRQFGDFFALFLSAICSACYYHDISKMMYIFVLSVILGVITIQNGNLVSTVITRLAVVNLSSLLNTISADASNLPLRLIEVAVSLVIIICSFISLAHMNSGLSKSLELSGDGTELTIAQKMRLLISSGWIDVFLLLALVELILSVRFI